MEKRGQVTIFVIVGIVIVTAVGVFLFFKGSFLENNLEGETQKEISYPLKVQKIKDAIDYCLVEASKDGLYLIGKQGGYYNMPENSKPSFSVQFSPYNEEIDPILFDAQFSPIYYLNKKLVPDLNKINLEIEKAVKVNFDYCFEDFLLEIEDPYSLEYGDSEINVNFNDQTTFFKLTFPIIVSLSEDKFNLDTFSYRADFNFFSKYTIVKEIVSYFEKDPNYLPVGQITNLAYENDFTFEFTNLGENSFLVILQFEEEMYEGYPFIYTFILEKDEI